MIRRRNGRAAFEPEIVEDRGDPGDERNRPSAFIADVIAGEHLRAELAARSDRRLIADEVDEVHRQLVQRIETRDGWEASQVGPEMPTLADHARRLLEGIAAAGTGFFAAVFSFRLGWWSLAAIAAAVVLTLWVRRAPLWRSRANWFLVGIAGVVPVFVALLALAS